MKNNYRTIPLLICLNVFIFNVKAQTTLNATGSGDTYALINSVLAPGYNAVEAPDQPTGTHPAFGQHITQVFDATLNKNVFEFYSHLVEDNDISTGATDRQRVEIKTYSQSPANLLGTTGETITYKWRFKLPTGFQPSTTFTHIHQIKPVNGDDSDPLFTLTPRKGTPNRLELLYVATSAGSTTTLQTLNLSSIENVWVEATEIITVGATTGTGKYSFRLRRVSDGSILMAYNNAAIATIRADNSFIRPKWGIYRNVTIPADLRDEAVRFSDFSIAEGAAVLTPITYYWVGGTAVTSFTSNSNWNTQLDGSGATRAALAPDDVLIIDGSNVGGVISTTGAITTTLGGTGISCAQLKMINNASVFMQRPSGGGGSGTLTINGDGTADADLVIAAGSSFTINSPIADGSIFIPMLSTATGLVQGTCTIGNTGQHRITSQTTNGLVFASGSIFNSNNIPTNVVYPFGSSGQGVQNGVLFQAGSNLIFTGTRSPMAGTSTFQSCNMQPGSNFYVRANFAAVAGSVSNLKTYGNIFIENNANFTADGPFYKIDNLTINTGSTLTVHSSGNTPILGNLTVNGTLTAPVGSSNIIVMGGNSTQTISGAGAVTIPSFTVANFSDVILNRNISVGTTTNIVGKLTFSGSSQITGTGTFTSRVNGSATSVTGNTTAGSYLVTGVTGTLLGNVGLIISSPTLGVLTANTNVVGFSTSQLVINLSQPALTTSTGVTFNFFSESATLTTSNTNGFDPTTGSVIVAGTQSFQSETNYVFNGATTTPFSAALNTGSVTANANLTLNFPIRVYNTLAFNNSIITTTATDIITLDSAAVVTSVSNSGYVNGPARWRTTATTPVVFPVGKGGIYRPAIVTPAGTNISQYQAEYFNTGYGTYTIDAPLTSVNNTEYWDVQKISGANASVGLTLNSIFTGTPNAPTNNDGVLLAHFTGTAWVSEGGNYLAPANTVNSGTVTTGVLSSFSPFTLALAPISVLPLKLISFTANRNNGNIKLNWITSNEINVNSFVVEESTDGVLFKKIGNVNATNNTQINKYNFATVNNSSGNLYYRIKMINSNGSVEYSSIILLKSEKDNAITVYPNPVKNNLNISGLSENTILKIISVTGQNVLVQNVNATAISINVENLKAGVYFVEIFSNGKKVTSKIFIKE